MRILVVHNKYQRQGGEDAVFNNEVGLLRATEEVKTLVYENHTGFRGALQFILSVWNVFAVREIKKSIDGFQPDLIHLHNWHYAIGPLIIRTARKKKIPIVLTIHNYRLLCPSATLLNRESLFLDSLHVSFPWKAVQYKLYRNSYFQTFWLALVVWFHKKIGTWKLVDRYIVLTDFAKNVFASSSFGVGESKFSVMPNFVEDPMVQIHDRADYYLYIGRLSEEKGIEILLRSFKNKTNELYIAGEGHLKSAVISASKENPHIHYLGQLDLPSVRERMAHCSALIFPSIWYEGMPMTIIEAFAIGTPVIGSNLGAMSAMIRDGYNGICFRAGDSASLTEKIAYWENLDRNDKFQLSQNARASFEAGYTAERHRDQLLSIYRSVMKNITAN